MCLACGVDLNCDAFTKCVRIATMDRIIKIGAVEELAGAFRGEWPANTCCCRWCFAVLPPFPVGVDPWHGHCCIKCEILSMGIKL